MTSGQSNSTGIDPAMPDAAALRAAPSPTVHDLIAEICAAGVSIRAEGEHLRLDGDTARLGAELIAAIRARKSELLDLLAVCDERLRIVAGTGAQVDADAQRRHRLRFASGSGAATAKIADLPAAADPQRLYAATARLLARHRILREAVAADRDSAADAEALAATAFADVMIDGELDQTTVDALVDERFGAGSPRFQVWRLRHAGGDSVALLARRFVADEHSLRLLMDALLMDALTTPSDDAEPGSTGEASALEFADFAAAEARMLAHPANRLRLARAESSFGLHDHAATHAATATRIERRHWHLPATVADELLQFALEHGVAPLAALVATFEFAADVEALADRVAFALPLPNRIRPELETVVGPFENDIGFTAVAAPSEPLVARLPRLHERIASAYAQQDLPLPATASGRPLAVRLALEVAHRRAVGDAVSNLCADRHDDALSLRHRQDSDGLRIDAHFDPERIGVEDAERLLERYVLALRQLRVFAHCAADGLPQGEDALARFIASRRREPDVAIATVRGIFASVLGVASVAADANFFELAGNSLSVAKVVSRVKREFGVAVSFSEIFRHPTPAGLTALILGRSEETGLSLVARRPLQELPASPQQVRYFASYNIAIGPSGRMTVLHGEWENADAFIEAVAHVVQRHELLRTAYFERDGRLMQRVLAEAPPSIERVTLSSADPSAQRQELDGLVRKRPIDLQCAPLVNVLVADRGDGGLYSAFAVFNGILDAYSEGLLERELREAYALACAGRLAMRPPLALQYQDFCRWQNDIAQTDVHAKARDFWRALYPSDYRPFHYPVADDVQRRGQMRIFLLGEALSDAARKAAAACESSLFGYLLANFFELAAGIYGREDVSVGLLYHGRENEDMQDLIGYFVDMFCLRSDTDPAEGFARRVRKVNETLFRSVDMRSYQYHELAADHGRSPSDAVFPITGFHVNNVIVPGKEKQVPADFSCQVLPLPYAPKFDFNIYVHESNRGILLRMAYATCVADEAGAARIAERFVDIVRANTAAIEEQHP